MRSASGWYVYSGCGGLENATFPGMNVSVKHLIQLVALVFVVVAFVYQLNKELRVFGEPPVDYSAAHEVDVLMYGASWCGYCAKARKFMERKGITFIEYDIEATAEARQQFEELGGRGVPLFQIGGKVLKGYSPDELERLVSDKRLQLTNASL